MNWNKETLRDAVKLVETTMVAQDAAIAAACQPFKPGDPSPTDYMASARVQLNEALAACATLRMFIQSA